MRHIVVHPAAVAEARAVRQWYADHSEQAASAFIEELDEAIQVIAEGPERWPMHVHHTRRYLLRRFPFLVVYRCDKETVTIVAVAHGHRRPGYWRDR